MEIFDDLTEKINETLTQIRGEWTITENGTNQSIASFSSFVSMDVSSSSSITNYPVEEGSFTSVNKANSPDEITVVLSKSGPKEDIAAVISILKFYKESTRLINITTPFQNYFNMNITGMSYSHTTSNNATLLTVTLNLQEIRQVTPKYSFITVKDPEMSGTQDTGKAQAEEIDNRSALRKLADKLTEWLTTFRENRYGF